MAETERVVVSPYMEDSGLWHLDEFDPETMHRAWSSWEREKRAYPRHYKGSLPSSYPILPRELVDRYGAAKAAFMAAQGEIEAALSAAPRKHLDRFAVELGWTPDDFRS